MNKTSPFVWRTSKVNSSFVSDSGMKGAIESFTIVHIAPKGFEKNTPYIVGLIALNNGKKIISQVVDCKNLSIGAKVEPCVRKISASGNEGIIEYGIKYRLAK